MKSCPRCNSEIGTWAGAFADWLHCASYPECLYVVRVERPNTETRQLRLLEVA